jgi:hypothetical protein
VRLRAWQFSLLVPDAAQAVKSVDVEKSRLEAEAEALADQQGDQVEARLEDIYERWVQYSLWLRYSSVMLCSVLFRVVCNADTRLPAHTANVAEVRLVTECLMRCIYGVHKSPRFCFALLWHKACSDCAAACRRCRLDALDSDMAEVRAASILHGLGFNKDMQVRSSTDQRFVEREFSAQLCRVPGRGDPPSLRLQHPELPRASTGSSYLLFTATPDPCSPSGCPPMLRALNFFTPSE